MAIELDIRSLLLSQPGITSLVPPQTIGGTSYPAVFNEFTQQGFNTPYIILSMVDNDPALHLGETSGTETTDIDIDCFARTYIGASAIADAVRAFFDDFSGFAGASEIQAVHFGGRSYDSIFEGQGRDVREHIMSLRYSVMHS